MLFRSSYNAGAQSICNDFPGASGKFHISNSYPQFPLLHYKNPERHDAEEGNIYKYADSGIHETIRKLSAFGMVKSRTVVKIAGGAKMFEIRGNAEFGNIGSRNTFMVKKILQEENMRISAEDTGGAFARTMILDIESGDVAIRTMGKPERHL